MRYGARHSFSRMLLRQLQLWISLIIGQDFPEKCSIIIQDESEMRYVGNKLFLNLHDFITKEIKLK